APWMALLCDYHAWMRVALDVKLRLRGQRAPSLERAAVIAAEVNARSPREVDATFVFKIAAPPGGRVRDVVTARVAVLRGASEEAVRGLVMSGHASPTRDINSGGNS
ncbi:MAG: hypothetical protein WCJ30_17855, partial [Deltaproteobacteria bacterium]